MSQSIIPDPVTITCNGASLSGWQRVAITRSLDTVPASFDLQITEKYPLIPSVVITPGMSCTVSIGGDVVITGYVDRYAASVSGNDHGVRIQGRSKSQDLVDCSAFVGDPGSPTFRVMSDTALAIAQKIAQPYGITIASIAGPGVTIPQFNINLGETSWEIIDRVIRGSKLLCYDLPDGTMRMAQAGTEAMASGFTLGEGGNAEACAITYAMDGRYSEYIGHFLSVTALGDDAGVNSPGVGDVITDTGVPRFRRRYVISEQVQSGMSLAYDRALWERNRRIGRSQVFAVRCGSWRDAGGSLWAPNHTASIDAAALKLASSDWVIATVTYARDENGTHGDLTLMPASAFSPEPVVVQPQMVLAQDVGGSNNPTAVPPASAPSASSPANIAADGRAVGSTAGTTR
jgi:prophage tail gpP-like protein